MNKALIMKTGQTHMQRYLKPLLAKIEAGETDPSFVITHTVPLDKAPEIVQDLPRQEGRLHQGGAETLKNAMSRNSLKWLTYPLAPCGFNRQELLFVKRSAH